MPPQITAIPAAASHDEPVATGLLVDVIVLSAESPLYESSRNAVGERNPVWRARSAEEAVDMLLLGRCGVLVVDMASIPMESASLIERIHAQFPDVVVVVAGSRDDEAALAGLVSDGLIYRYMHKPLSARRAGMFLNAAIQQYTERRGRRDFAPLLPIVGRLPERVPARYWAIPAGLIVTVVLGGALLSHDDPAPSLLTPPAETQPAATSSTPRADPVLSRARAALAAGRYEAPEGRNALDLYRAVLLAKPEHAEARVGLERTLAAIVAEAERHWQDGDRSEAERLLHRVLEAESAQPAAQALLARMQPVVVEDAPRADEEAVTAVRAPAEEQPARVPAVVAALPAPKRPDAAAVQPAAAANVAVAPLVKPAVTAAAKPTVTAVAKPTVTAGAKPTVTAVAKPTVTAVAKPTVTAAAKPTVTAAAKPTVTAVAKPTVTAAAKPTVTAVAKPTVTAVAKPTVTAAAKPTVTAVAKPVTSPPRVSSAPVADPLQPKLAMTSPKRTTQRGHVFGAPISSGHPTAGMDTRRYVPPKVATAAVGTAGMAATTRAQVPTAAPRAQPTFLDARELEQVSMVEPVYPAAAMRSRQQGWVTLDFTVTETGTVSDPWITDAEPADVFDAAAIAAVRQWRFKPRVANGRAVAVRSSVTLRFAVDR